MQFKYLFLAYSLNIVNKILGNKFKIYCTEKCHIS